LSLCSIPQNAACRIIAGSEASQAAKDAIVEGAGVGVVAGGLDSIRLLILLRGWGVRMRVRVFGALFEQGGHRLAGGEQAAHGVAHAGGGERALLGALAQQLLDLVVDEGDGAFDPPAQRRVEIRGHDLKLGPQRPAAGGGPAFFLQSQAPPGVARGKCGDGASPIPGAAGR
jgi:hypothetical protein